VLINTCSVRRHAGVQRRTATMGMLAKLKKKKPHLVLGFVSVVTAEKDKEIIFERLPHVTWWRGLPNIYEIPIASKMR